MTELSLVYSFDLDLFVNVCVQDDLLVFIMVCILVYIYHLDQQVLL